MFSSKLFREPGGGGAAKERYRARFLEETGATKARVRLRKRLRRTFRAAGWAVFFLIRRKNRRSVTDNVVLLPKRKTSPRAQALEFMEKVQKGVESPAVRLAREKQEQDLKTAEKRMTQAASGDLARLHELRERKKHLDDVEKEILLRLEAKLQGLIVAAEIERKDAEIREKKMKRKERVKENEKNYLQSKLVARLEREEKVRRLIKAPFRRALRVLTMTMSWNKKESSVLPST